MEWQKISENQKKKMLNEGAQKMCSANCLLLNGMKKLSKFFVV